MKNNSTVFLEVQKLEITEYCIFLNLAKLAKKNKSILEELSSDSFKHYQYWEKITKTKVLENKIKVLFFTNLARIFGLTFTIKMLEKEEIKAEKIYEKIKIIDKNLNWIIEEEKEHEKKIVNLIDEELLKYTSSIVLGLSDALVELTGTLAGLTLTLQDHRLIGTTGLITGLAASLSMASSEYLSIKSGIEKKNPIKAAIYTGITYVSTTVVLIIPYFIFQNYLVSLMFTMISAASINIFSSFYISITQELSFKKRLLEGISLTFGVALISFAIGILVHQILHLNI